MTEDEKEAHDYEMFISPTIWPSKHEFEIGLAAWKERGRRDNVTIQRLEEIIRANDGLSDEVRFLLEALRPEIQARIAGFTAAWPGREILCALHRNEALLNRIDAILTR